MIDRVGGATTLMTGATGFVGRELVRELLGSHPTLRLLALVRAADDTMLATRRSALVADLPPDEAGRLDVVRGDMAAPRLGCTSDGWRSLVERVERVIHCAASIRFDLALAAAREQNVASTRTILELCRAVRARGGSGRLDYVSTAFVAGTRQGVVGENELWVGQTFRNTYEQTKCEAEALCRDASGDVPVAIYRPSIVVGRQRSGATTSYKAAYGPMRVLIGAYNTCPRLLNRIVPLPLPPDLIVDLVPVDYVAAATAALWAREDSVGRCHHLAAGRNGAARLRDLADLTCDYFRTPHLRFWSPGRALRGAGRVLAPFLGIAAPKAATVLTVTYAYGLGMPVFDTANTCAAGFSAPPVLQYFEAILRFAATTQFGRRHEEHDAPPRPSRSRSNARGRHPARLLASPGAPLRSAAGFPTTLATTHARKGERP